MAHSITFDSCASLDNLACMRAEWAQSKRPLPAVNQPHPEQDRWFEEEVRPCEPALRAYLRGAFPDLTDLDDLVQDSYVRLLEAKRKRPIDNAQNYLFSIARNSAINQLRRPKIFSEKPISDYVVQSVAEEGRDVAGQVATRQEVDVLLDAIDTLPGRCQEIFILIKLKGLSHQEVAERLGLSINTVHVQVARGLQKCSEYLRVKGVLET